MAVVKGIKEKVHLPLYDSLFVRPQQQLREVHSSGVFKFFVHVQGKTKLETNMQAAALLPHWNTFEARALRVVISDLPVRFPAAVTQCLAEPDGNRASPARVTLTRCLNELAQVIADEKHRVAEQLLATAHHCVTEHRNLVAQAAEITENLDECLGVFTALCDQHTMGRILQLHSELRTIATDLVEVLRRTRIAVTDPTAVSRFINTITALSQAEDDTQLFGKLGKAQACLHAFRQLLELLTQLKQASLPDAQRCVDSIEQLIHREAKRVICLERVRECFQEVQTQLAQLGQLGQLGTEARQADAEAIRRCLRERLRNELLIPIDEQLFANGAEILSKLVYQSVTSFVVGEKTMMQMPTWFFPAGAGPYAEGGRVVTHGFPTPEATFHFAEPVLIDAQQNFRVEIEVPDATTLSELQRIYGPFFIWVVLDGYMQRDVQ
jgi:hypothetical protein